MTGPQSSRAASALTEAAGAPVTGHAGTNGCFPPLELLFRQSEKMRAVEELVRRVADTRVTVLIHGETGVGKELVAKAIHRLSNRAGHPWVKVNCAALPPELLESELFGHEKGAFTGAAARKLGRFELAQTGTLLLDEIAEMPLRLQAKILHVIQDSEFFRVGGRELIQLDVRLLAATNRDIAPAVRDGVFREDLYYRLNVVNIAVPPLRDRPEEIVPLVRYFSEHSSQLFKRQAPELSDGTVALLHVYGWPGNIRELENLIQRCVVLGHERYLRSELEARIGLVTSRKVVPLERPASQPAIEGGLREIGRRAASEAEQRVIQGVLDAVGGNRSEAARRLKISYNTLLAKIRQAEHLTANGPSLPRSA